MNKEIVLKNNVKLYRTKKGLSQEELATSTGTTRQTIIAVEKGNFNPSTKLALLISLVLEQPIEKLFYLD